MATNKTTKTLLKRVIATNIVNSGKSDISITPLVSGRHGIGKSASLVQAVKELNGYPFVVNCQTLGEGVIGGYPVPTKNAITGTLEVRFSKYYVIQRIVDLEEEIYNKAKTEGFLNGALKLDEETGNTTYTHVVEQEGGKTKTVTEIFQGRSQLEKVLDGGDNLYKFGDNLPVELRKKLLASGEIKLVVIFFDELNRVEPYTQKEFMNIILNRTINGYKLPWWTDIVAAINPASSDNSYAVTEMDDAQRDRFLEINMTCKLDEWLEHGSDVNMNDKLLMTLSAHPDLFMEKTNSEYPEMKPSPRSWEMVSMILNSTNEVNDMVIAGKRVFTPEELKDAMTDVKTLVSGKVGRTVATTFFAAYDNTENFIFPSQIITGTSKEIPEEVFAKFNRQTSLSKHTIANSVAKYIIENYENFVKLKKSPKNEYDNFVSQFKQFIMSLNKADQVLFCKALLTEGGTGTQKGRIFNNLIPYVSKDILMSLQQYNTDIKMMTD